MAKKTIQIADKPTVDEILALLESTEVGLAVLKGLLGKGADAATLNAVKALLENGTYGLSAIKNAISGRANETTVAAVKSLLENGTYGLNALKTLISTANTNILAVKGNTFKETRYGVLQINTPYVPSVPGTTSTSQKIHAYSGELSITGNGKITFYNAPDFANTFSNNTIKLIDVTIDGCIINNTKSYTMDGFVIFTNNSGRNTNDKLISLEFSKSFKAKLAYFGDTTNTRGDAIAAKTCTDSASYFVQLR